VGCEPPLAATDSHGKTYFRGPGEGGGGRARDREQTRQ
jgi:hypothetical protein